MPRLRSGSSSSSAAAGSDQFAKPKTRFQTRKIIASSSTRVKRSPKFKPEPQPEPQPLPEPLTVPKALHFLIQKALSLRSGNPPRNKRNACEWRLDDLEERIKTLADFFKSINALPSDWELDYNTATRLVPEQDLEPLPPQEKLEVSDLLSPIPLSVNEKKTWERFRLHHQSGMRNSYTISAESLPCLENDNAFTSSLCKFAVGTFNNTYSRYANKAIDTAVSQAQVTNCGYQGVVGDGFYFYMTITALEQGEFGVYKAVVKCDLLDGARTLCLFRFKGPKPTGETPTSKSKSETVEDVHDRRLGTRDHYRATGLIYRSGTKGFNFSNPKTLWLHPMGFISKPDKVK